MPHREEARGADQCRRPEAAAAVARCDQQQGQRAQQVGMDGADGWLDHPPPCR